MVNLERRMILSLNHSGQVVIRGIQIITHYLEKETIRKSDSPLTLNEAKTKINFQFPKSAKNIYFADYNQWIVKEFLMKFDASLEDCKSFSLNLIEKHNQEAPKRKIPNELFKIEKSPDPFSPQPSLKVKWFDIDRIKHGFYAGKNASHTPRIWIDSDRNKFYYLYTD